MKDTNKTVADKEDVVRVLNREWFSDGQLLHVAFALRHGETYISVNRPAVLSYLSDVEAFVKTHPSYVFSYEPLCYRIAEMNVASVRAVSLDLSDKSIDIDVEIEPRDSKIASHAGIFTRFKGSNLKPGDSFSILEDSISADAILLKVRMQLLKLATVKECAL